MNRKAFDTEKHTMNVHAKTALAVLLWMAATAVTRANFTFEIEATQRYPWNGMVDLACNLSHPLGAQVQSFTVADVASGTGFPVKTLWDADGTPVGEGYELPAGDTHLFWNAAADLPKDWKSDRMTLTGNIRHHQTVTFGNSTYSSDGTQTILTATALSGNGVDFEVVSGPGVVEGNVLTFTGPERVTVRAIQAGDEDWLPASATKTFAALYTVLDLSAGSGAGQYPVSYLAVAPSGGFTKDVYRTTKLALRRVEAGTFKMGSSQTYTVTLTKPFLMGVFEVTENQWKMVKGSSGTKTTPIVGLGGLKWENIRGNANWPSSRAVGTDSFMGRLRARTGLAFDLPTDAQWEYACRAGSTGKFAGTGKLDDMGWYQGNTYYNQPCTVGQKNPNAWGLYDMHGNAWEWCLDWYPGVKAQAVDPVGPSSGEGRVLRGGSCDRPEDLCATYSKSLVDDYTAGQYYGFRLSCQLSN